MAIQTTNNFVYNYATYTAPYFRLVAHLPVSGEQTPIDCVMYESSGSYQAGSGSITTLPFAVTNISASADNSGDNVVNKYLLYVTEKVTGSLEEISPDSTFTVVEIPTV